MWKQIRLLTGISLRNLCGWNQIKYGKDQKKKNRLVLLAVTYAILGVVLAFYAGMLGFGCVLLGMADIVPAYVLAVVSLVILFFSVFKAGSILFDTKSYEMMISLPVKPAAIVMSRFLTMYAENLAVGMVVLLPASGVYAYFVRPGALFYVTILAGAVLMPLLPMTAATAVGAAVMAVSSRMKHKNLISIVLLMGLTIGTPLLLLGRSSDQTVITEQMLQNIASLMAQQIYGIYPPARLFTAGVVEGNMGAFLTFAVISIGSFLMLAALVQWKFAAICTALNAAAAGKNYKMQNLTASSPLNALYKRELKRYFSSVIYVCNTLVGYVLMVVMAAGVLVAGKDKMEQMMGLPGLINRVMPMALAFMCGFSSTTTSSISMEGKQWWLVRSLPVSTGQILSGKMLVNLTMALPCYAAAQILLLLSSGGTVAERMWTVIVPFVYIMFGTVLGIAINCRMPIFEWESESAVVKQSGATLAALVVNFITVLVPLMLLIVFKTLSMHLVLGAATAVIMCLTVILYSKNRKIDLKTIE